MKQCKHIFILSLITFTFYNTSYAQEDVMDASPLSISGSVDAYFRTNLTTDNTIGGSTIAPATSFAKLPGFSLGMVNVILEKEKCYFGFVADLVMGPRGTDAVFL